MGSSFEGERFLKKKEFLSLISRPVTFEQLCSST